MALEAFAIGGFTVLFLVSFTALARRDVFASGVYLFLYIYTIFTQIGYLYYPELSHQINAYFGSEIFLTFNIFVALSFATFFIVVLLLLYLTRDISYRVTVSKHALRSPMFLAALLTHIVLITSYFITNYDALNYQSASDESFIAEQGLPYALFGIGFKFSVAIILSLYVLIRLKSKLSVDLSPRALQLFLVIEGLLFIAIATKLGNRTDLLALTLGICMFEYLIGGGRRKLFKLFVFVCFVLYGFVLLESSRIEGLFEDQLLYQAIIFKDYFAPSHILLAAIAYDFVHPIEVLKSNVLNALVMFGHPYLQATVTELFNPGISTRSSSYAFYIFSEGYIALGKAGFLYNGVVVGIGVLLWRKMAATNNIYYNMFVLALVSTQMANVVRGQSSYFIKDVYLYFLPAMALFFLATGLRPALTWPVHARIKLGIR